MKAQHIVASAAILLVALLASQRPNTFADQTAENTPRRNRMIDLLSEGSIIRLDSVHQAYDVILLNEEQVQKFRDLVKRTEEELQVDGVQISGGIPFGKEDGARRGHASLIAWQNLQSPWRVLMVGDDYVRLEPLVQLAGREKTSWIALPESMVRMIKSTEGVGH